MTVTEFALIKLRSDYDEIDFLETLMQCQEVQDEWVHAKEHRCAGCSSAVVSSMFIDSTASPPRLLITAPWASREAHGEWIRSKDNQTIFAQLEQFIAPARDSTVLVHLDSAGGQAQLSPDLLTQGAFNVEIIEVEPAGKDALQAEYRRLEGDLLAGGAKQRIWAGWKIEEPDDNESLVIFWSRAKVPEERITKLAGMGSSSQQRFFKHVV